MNFQVADWYVDTDANRIQCGNQDIKLEGKVMSLLVYLAKNQGSVVSREQLEADVWSDRVISYDALTSCITRLRKVLGDDSRKPRFIETVPKKGYRLIASVDWNTDNKYINISNLNDILNKQHKYKSHYAIFAAILLMLAIAGTAVITSTQHAADDATVAGQAPSVIVLPFDNLSDQPGQTYFSDGITADISIALSRLSGLQVIAPPSALDINNDSSSVQSSSSRQLARYVLTGNVQRAGNQLRVNVMLIDNRSHQQLWAEQYDRELTAVFDVQDDITSKIVSTLSVKLTEQEKKRVARRYTNSIEAYDQFLRGQAFYTQHNNNENLLAREHLTRAIQLDPNFARAYSTLALTYVDEYRYQWPGSIEQPLLKTLELSEQAVAIDNSLPQAHWALAYAQLHLHRYDQAMETISHALSVNPNYADGYAILALIHIYRGEPAQGLAMIRKAMRLNPDYPAQFISVLGQAHYYLDEYENAVLVLRDAIDKNFNLRTAHIMLTAALSKAGMAEEASWSATQLLTISPQFRLHDVARIFPIRNDERLNDITAQLRNAGLA